MKGRWRTWCVCGGGSILGRVCSLPRGSCWSPSHMIRQDLVVKQSPPNLPSSVFLLPNHGLASCTPAQGHHVLCGPYSCCGGWNEHPSAPVRRGSRFDWSRTTFLGRRVAEGVLRWEQAYPGGGGYLGAAMEMCIDAPTNSAPSAAHSRLPRLPSLLLQELGSQVTAAESALTAASWCLCFGQTVLLPSPWEPFIPAPWCTPPLTWPLLLENNFCILWKMTCKGSIPLVSIFSHYCFPEASM